MDVVTSIGVFSLLVRDNLIHSELAGTSLADCSSINNFLGVCYSYFGSCCKPLHVHFFCITCEVGIPFGNSAALLWLESNVPNIHHNK